MAPDPWRPQDIADVVLGRPSGRVEPDVSFLDGLEVSDIREGVDAVYIVVIGGAGGRPQLYLWPMVLHRHGPECCRA